ncbi:MAG: protein kinase domain-containing protein [Cyanobacterium sp.]
MEKIINNRYEIINNLNKGDTRETFLAKDTQMPSEKLVVIKKLKLPHSEKNNLELVQTLFTKQAQTLEQIGQNSTQIPHLYDYFTEDEQFYLIQEYIDGKNLIDLDITNFAQCEAILSSLLSTLKYIHSQNIIHRNIKPENIIIRNNDGLPVLTDFGVIPEIMGAVNHSTPETSPINATTGFIAPEQNAGKILFASDLYALGLTMIYTLTGKYPMEFNHNPLTGELDWDSSLPNIPAPLKTILQKAIKIEIGQRYHSAQEMYLALHQSQPQTISQATVLVAPNNDMGAVNSSSYNPTMVVSPSSQNFSQANYPPPVSGINPSQGYYQHPPHQDSNQNIIIILLTAILVAIGVSGGFFIAMRMGDSQQTATVTQGEVEISEELIGEIENSPPIEINEGETPAPSPVENNSPPPTANVATNARIGGSMGVKNIRSGPGTAYGIVGTGVTGEGIDILDSGYDSGGYLWYRVYHPTSGVTGWMAAQLVN